MLQELIVRQTTLLEMLLAKLKEEHSCLLKNQSSKLFAIAKEKSQLLLQVHKLDNQIKLRPELKRQPLPIAINESIDQAKLLLGNVQEQNNKNKQLIDASLASINRFTHELNTYRNEKTLTYTDDGLHESQPIIGKGFTV